MLGLTATFSCAALAHADGPDKSGVKPQVINLPSGPGSIQGLGDAFQPQLNTGTAGYRVPLSVPAGTGGHTPSLALVYNGGQGNGPFGLGWRLDLPAIQRQTDKGLPCYDAATPAPCGERADQFIHSSGEELVGVVDGTYRFKVEGSFTRFMRSDGGWEGVERNGTRWTFGETPDGRQTNTLGTFLWQPQRATDVNGNEIRFYYAKDSAAVTGDADAAQSYLTEIRYNFDRSSPYGAESPDSYVSISIEYDQQARPDKLDDYRSRFRVRTAWRAKAIVVRALGQLVRRYELSYDDSDGTSLLTEVRELGTDLARFEQNPSGALPPLHLGYTRFDPARAQNVAMSNPPPLRVGSPNVDLVDINGDGLPDIVYTDPSIGGGHRFYINQGRGRWATNALIPEHSPLDLLSTDGVQIADMDGDGRADLLVKPGTDPTSPFYYYANPGDGGWDLTQRVDLGASPPFTFEDRDVQLMDLDNDKRADVLRTTDSRYEVYFNRPPCRASVQTGCGWSGGPDRVLTTPPAYGHVLRFTDPGVHLADMNGDHLQDMTYITEHGVVYFAARGLGDFDTRVQVMQNSPDLTGRAADALLVDVNGDGLADLVLVDYNAVTIWLNEDSTHFSAPISLTGSVVPMYVAGQTSLRVADMNGSGAAGLLYSTYPLAPGQSGDDILRYLDFNQGTLPHLLTTIDNGLGRTITLTYRSSTDYYVDDLDAGQPWSLRSPVPVAVVSRSTVHDANSGQDYVTDYTYRNAYYDNEDKAFRGFALAQQIDRGDSSASTEVQRIIFDTGAQDRSRKGLVLQTDVLGEGGTCGPDTSAAAEAAGTLPIYSRLARIAPLKDSRSGAAADVQEFGAGAGSSLSACYRRTSNQIYSRQLASEGQSAAAGHTPRVVSFSVISQTDTLSYEATTTPRRTQQTFAYDDYGNQTQRFDYGEVALDGANRGLGDDERLTYTTYAISPTIGVYDRVATVRTTDLNGGFVSEQRRYYDGPAFVGLALGQVARGNLTRVEDNTGPSSGNHWVQSQRYRYDSYGNQVARMDPDGIVSSSGDPDGAGHWTQITYDPVFHAYPVAEADQIAAGRALTVTAEYDLGQGVITHAVEFNGQELRFRYDSLARLTALVKPGDTLELPTQVFSYTLGGAVSAVTTESRVRSGTADVFRSVSYVDGLGRQLQTRTDGEDGKVVVRDAMTFNARGKERDKFLPYYATTPTLAYSPPDASLPKTSAMYDPLLRQVRTTNPDGTFGRTEYRPFEQTVFDDEETNPASPHFNQPKTFRFDGLGRQIQTLEHSGTFTYTTSFGYDLLDNLTSITDANGNVKRQTFDGLKRKLSMDDLDRGVMTYTYDDAGNLLETVDAKGQHLQYTYDGVNRILTETDGSTGSGAAPDVRYHYDADLAAEHSDAANAMGRLAWIEDRSGREYRTYDARGNLAGRIKRLSVPGHGPALDFVTLMRYDDMERPIELTYPDGVTVTYRYNGQSLLDAIPGYVDHVGYLASGQRAALATSDGVQTSYGYDSRLRLTDLHAADPHGAALQSLRYHFDGVSNIVGIDDLRSDRTTADDDTRAFTLDDLYRLTEVRYPAGAGDHIDYAYDPLGNLVHQASNIPSSDLGDLQYGQAAGPHALTQVGSAVWSYDHNGNLTAKPWFTYGWDTRDRLTSVSGANGLRQDNLYDYGGERIAKQVSTTDGTQTVLYPDNAVEVRGAQLIKYVFAGDQRVAEVRTLFSRGRLIQGFSGTPQPLFGFDADHDGTVSADEIAARGGDPNIVELDEINDALALFFAHTEDEHPPLSFATLSAALDNYRAHAGSVSPPASDTLFYHPDHLGSSTVLVNGQGALAERVSYYPYGSERVRAGNADVTHRFTGKELDAEIGLYDYGARFYDPVVGRFISVDAMSSSSLELAFSRSQSLNVYAYGNDNPVVYVDPNGLWPTIPLRVILPQWNPDPNGKLSDPHLNPNFVKAAQGFLAAAVLEGFRPVIQGSIAGYRTPEESAAAHQRYLAGGPKANDAWESVHNYGLGVDVTLINPDGSVNPGKTRAQEAVYNKLAQVAAPYGLVTGVKNDTGHYEYHPAWPNPVGPKTLQSTRAAAIAEAAKTPGIDWISIFWQKAGAGVSEPESAFFWENPGVSQVVEDVDSRAEAREKMIRDISADPGH